MKSTYKKLNEIFIKPNEMVTLKRDNHCANIRLMLCSGGPADYIDPQIDQHYRERFINEMKFIDRNRYLDKHERLLGELKSTCRKMF